MTPDGDEGDDATAPEELESRDKADDGEEATATSALFTPLAPAAADGDAVEAPCDVAGDDGAPIAVGTDDLRADVGTGGVCAPESTRSE